MMRFRLVRKPEDAGFGFAGFHKSEVRGGQQVCSRFCNGPQDSRGRLLPPRRFDSQVARLAPNEFDVAFGFRQVTVENGGVALLPCLAFLYQQAYVFAQSSGAIQKNFGFKVGSAPSDHWETGFFQPVPYILITLQDVDELSCPHHSCVQKVERWMASQEERGGRRGMLDVVH